MNRNTTQPQSRDTKMKWKRMSLPLFNLLASFASAVALFFGTVKINFLLIANWLARANVIDQMVSYPDDPYLDKAWLQLISELQALRESSAYARFLTDPHILWTVIILVLEIVIFAGLLWLAKQNLKVFVRVAFK